MATKPRTRLLLLCTSAAIMLALGEVVIRGLGLAPGFGSVKFGQHAGSEDPVLGWTNAPHAEGINSIGLRGPEIRDPKRGRRVICLGDSIAFGYGLKPEETIERKLEERLVASGVDAEVLNAGVVAYNTRQEGRWLEMFGPALAPDAVVVLYCLNDTTDLGSDAVPEDLAREAYKHNQKDNWARQRSLPRLGPFTRWLLSSSHLARLVYFAGSKETTLGIAGNKDLVTKGWSRDFGVVEDGFGRIARYCKSAGIPATVVIVPWLERLEPYPPAHLEQHQKVAEIAKKHGLTVLDLLPAFAAHQAKNGRGLAQPGDPVHPNVEGCDVAAAAIAETLAKQ